MGGFAKFTLTPSLQNQLDETRKNYELYIESVQTIQADTQQLEELKEVNLLLRAQIAKANQQAVKAEKQLRLIDAKLKRGINLLNETTASSTFPVLQTNGLVVDFCRVISKWASAAEDDEGTATREFVCASTQKTTTLARFPMTDRIQQIAGALGLKIEPPLLFEREEDDVWVQLSSKEHIDLTATVCYLYANRDRLTTANTLLGEDVISFRISKVKLRPPFYYHTLTHGSQTQGSTPFALHCKSLRAPVRVRIGRADWNPFQDMLVGERHC